MTEPTNNGQNVGDSIADQGAKLEKLISEAQQTLDQIRGIQSQVASEISTIRTNLKTQESDFKTAIDSYSSQVEANNAKFLETKAKFDANVQAINELAIKATETDKKITEHETAIGELNKNSTKQLEEIVKLLPAATSAGLASQFNERRAKFLGPQKNWNRVFFVAIGFLILVGIVSLVQGWLHDGEIDFLYIAKTWMMRAPLVAVLLWVAIYAASERALAKRLEEDYAFKAAVSASLYGFQAQAEKISTVDPNAPISKLYDNTLKEIANSPGRIYEKHKLVPTIKDDLGK